MAGVGSRRHNDALILSGAVRVNGVIVQELGTRVLPGKDKITVDGKPVHIAGNFAYIVLNKPKDAITTLRDEKGRATIMEYVRLKERVFPVGRLDRNTTGVLLLTNDGDLSNKLMHPRGGIERVYRVTLDRPIQDSDAARLRKGVELDDGPARPDRTEVVPGSKRLKVILTLREGRNREVRRLFEAIGYDVKSLDRLAFAGITAAGLARGAWRRLTREEVEWLKNIPEKKTGKARESVVED